MDGMRKSRWWFWGGLVAGLALAAVAVERRRARMAQVQRNRQVKVLVVGAGVVGSTYAARLARWGMEVTLLARGERLQGLLAHGLVLRSALTRRQRSWPVRVVAAVSPAEEYDLVLVAVRHTQVQGALAAIAPLAETTPILFLQHNPVGPEPLAQALGQPHVLLGFPATGGLRVRGEIVSLPFWLGATVIGESNGAHTQRLHQARTILQRAGFKVRVERRIVAWLKTQAALEAVLAGCLYRNGGDLRRLAAAPQELALYREALGEARQVLAAQGIRFDLGAAPPRAARALLRLAGALPGVGLLAQSRLEHAADEFRALHEQLLAAAGGLPVPALRSLGAYFPAG